MKGVFTMAKKKKTVDHFKIDSGRIIMEEKDIANLTEAENTKISFYVKTLGYEVVFLEPEPKKSNYFTVEKAERYLRRKDKEGLKVFKSFKEDADKITLEYKELKKAEKQGGKSAPDKEKVDEARIAMITAQRDAFLAQKQWFKDTYGIEEYDKVRKEY